jgi:hypothetical protein
VSLADRFGSEAPPPQPARTTAESRRESQRMAGRIAQ